MRAERAAEDYSDATDALEDFLTDHPHANVEPDLNQLGAGAGQAYRELVAAHNAIHRRLEECRYKMAPVPEHDPARLEHLRGLAEGWSGRQIEGELTSKNRFGWQGTIDSVKAKVRQRIDRITEYEAMCECPVCQAPGEGWKEKVIRDLRRENDADIASIQGHPEAIKRAEEKLRILAEETRMVKEELPRLEAIRRQAQEAAEAEFRLPALEEELKQAIAQVTAAEAAMRAAEEKGASLGKATALHGKWKQLAADAARLEPAAMGLTDARTAAQAALEALTAARTAHEAGEPARTAWADAQAREADLGRSRAEAEGEEKTLKGLTEHKTTVEAERATAIRAMFEPVIAVAEKVSEGILPTPLTLHPVNGQIGRWNGPSFIGFDAMSGTEQLLAVAALQIGLAGGGTVLLDELGRLDRGTKQSFIARLEQLVLQKAIAQVILVDHDRKDYDNGLWTVILPA